jgi:hypothetical protein
MAKLTILAAATLVSALSLLAGPAIAQSADQFGSQSKEVTMVDIPASATAKITVERRGEIVLIGINRPEIQNRLDPEAYLALAKAYYDYDRDPSLRAAVLFGHGANFSRGIDVDGFKSVASAGGPPMGDGLIDPLGKKMPGLTKPLVVAVHGDTWNMAHELFLVADVRVAADDTNFGQDEIRTDASRAAVRRSDSPAKPAGATRCATSSREIIGPPRRPIAWGRSRRLSRLRRRPSTRQSRLRTRSRLPGR